MIRFMFSALCVWSVIYVESTVVQTTLGPVKGRLVNDELTGASFYSFQGIPYAEAPKGKLRFKPPVKKTAWTTVFDATMPGKVCPQSETYHTKEEMDEDCLNFNVYTPVDGFNKSLPVVLSIHGGDFHLQSGNAEPIYGPQLLVQSNVLVVTINYRLGAAGFLSLNTEKVPGNAGLKDGVLALKTIYDNIRCFGGNPNKITIRGSGAGAAATQLYMMTNQTVGLFNNVMVHCGSCLSPKYIQLNPRKNAMLLATELGLNTTSDDQLMEELRQVDAWQIIKAQEALMLKDPQRGFRNFRPFKPTVEVDHPGAILTKTPLELMTEGAICNITVYMGFNNQEGLEMLPVLLKEPEIIDRFNQNFELLLPEDITYPEGSNERKKVAQQIKDTYFDGRNISFANIQSYVNLVSDSYYTSPIDRFVKLFKEKNKAPLNYYMFSSDTELNWFKAFENITFPGAAHSDNLGYTFITSVTKSKYQYLNATTKQAQRNVLQNIRNFASDGAPSSSSNLYPDAGTERYHTVINNTGPTPVYHRPIPERTGFWESVYNEQAEANKQKQPIGLIPAVLGLVGGLLNATLSISLGLG